jgi:hypothetical protein
METTMAPRRIRATPRRLVAAAVLLHALTAWSQDAPRFLFSGYGTLGVAHSNNDQADYLVDAFKPNGPGFTRDWSWDVDSRLGAQLSAIFGPRLSAVVQVLAQQRHDDSYRPVVEWANVKYQVTPDFSVRAGRVVLPIFMVTDSRRVGYANPWVRPPVEVYSLVPVTSSDGMDAAYRIDFGAVASTVQVTAGRSTSRFPNSSGFEAGTAEGRKLFAANATFESGAFTGRVTYGDARLTIAALDPFFDAFRQFGPEGIAIADRFHVRDRRVTFMGVGATYDPGQWFVMGELARFNTRSIVGDKVAWYVSGGYRIGKFTPYATFARARSRDDVSHPGLTLPFYPPEVQPVAAALNAALNMQLGVAPQQSTASLGARWDFHPSAALKVQYDRVRLDHGSRGTFGNVQPGFQPGSTVSVFSVAVDFVF